MANPQHIEWLLEGVEAWNKRRSEDNFKPDLSGENLRELFEQAGRLSSDGRMPLHRANLREANLSRADLRGADLQRANLPRAQLWRADLQGANLQEANMRKVHLEGANLRGANLQRADLLGAEVTSFGYSAVGSNDTGTAEYTDLSTALNLSQTQLDTMKGDSETLLPDGLTRPDHWPEFDETDPGPPSDAVTAIPDRSPQAPTEAPSNEPEPPLQTRVLFHLTHARTASLNAQTVAALIDAETTYLRQTSNQLGPEIDLFEDLSALLKTFAKSIETPGPDVSALERQLEEAKTKIEDLTAKLEEAEKAAKSPSAFSEEFQKSAGKALGVAVIAVPLGAITGGLA